MAEARNIDWPKEIRLLRQLLPMASTVHVVAADALLYQFQRLSKKPEAQQETKILVVKLIAEAMSALEDFAALCRAVRRRDECGIIHAYLHYRLGAVENVTREIQKSSSPWSYLRLFAPREYVNNPEADNPNLIMDLDLILGSAAKWRSVPGMVGVYNKAKHGFTVLKGPPETESAQRADDDTIYVLCNNGEYVRINSFRDWPERAKMVIDTCADGWRNLAQLIIFMHERGYDLSLTNAPSPSARGGG